MTLNIDIARCTVAEVMGTDLSTLTAETTVGFARQVIAASGSDHLIVVEDGALAGIVSGKDLHAAPRDARLADCMTSPVLCISADTTLQEAVDIMGDNDVDCLPVVTGAYIVGLVTRDALALGEQARSEARCDVCAHSGATQSEDATPDFWLCERCRELIEANGSC
ncbi:MAG TPA: CBS domain-containing protein [Polyangia bacterium]|jgi:CBS domain-containing protein